MFHFQDIYETYLQRRKKGGGRKRGEGGRKALKTSSFSFPLRRVFLLQKAFFNLSPFPLPPPQLFGPIPSPFISDGGKRRGKLFRLPKKRGGRRRVGGGSRSRVFTHNKGGKGGTADGGGPFLKKSCGRGESAVCGGRYVEPRHRPENAFPPSLPFPSLPFPPPPFINAWKKGTGGKLAIFHRGKKTGKRGQFLHFFGS